MIATGQNTSHILNRKLLFCETAFSYVSACLCVGWVFNEILSLCGLQSNDAEPNVTQSVTSLHPPMPFHCTVWNMWLISSQPLFFSNFFSEHWFSFLVLNETGLFLLMLHSKQNSRVENLFACVFPPLTSGLREEEGVHLICLLHAASKLPPSFPFKCTDSLKFMPTNFINCTLLRVSPANLQPLPFHSGWLESLLPFFFTTFTLG